jgi:hypothetical protein
MSTPVRTAVGSLHVFLERVIDYAGLFAPASLDMMTSLNNYSRYLDDPQRWALGRFVLPVTRLDEFLNAQENVATDPWQLSGVVSTNIEADLAAVDEFNRSAPGAVMDWVEVRVDTMDEVDLVRRNQPKDTTVLFEFAPERANEFLPILRNIGGCAKLRTGGVTEEAIPALECIATFVARCAELSVPFKATAGLHHPYRCIRPLTYEANSPLGKMHGFMNLFTSAAIAWNAVQTGEAIPRAALAACLADGQRANWHFGDDALTWSGETEPILLDLNLLRAMRSEFGLSFGSCSFEEPLQDMRELELL